MGIINKPYATADGTSAVGANVSSNFDTIYAEFNGNIDNNNIKNNAGIVDTKLATITTAGKVSTTALTGTFPNNTFAYITATNLLSTNIVTTTITATTLSAVTVKATTLNATTASASNFVGTILGTWSGLLVTNTAYQALTDGFVVATSYPGIGNGSVLSDSSNPPLTTITSCQSHSLEGSASVTCPIRKNDYWQLIRVSGTWVIRWIPLGA